MNRVIPIAIAVITVLAAPSALAQSAMNPVAQAPASSMNSEHSDAWILGKVRAKLPLARMSRDTSLTIAVRAGVVYLSGYASGRSELMEFERAIKRTPGVNGIDSSAVTVGN